MFVTVSHLVHFISNSTEDKNFAAQGVTKISAYTVHMLPSPFIQP